MALDFVAGCLGGKSIYFVNRYFFFVNDEVLRFDFFFPVLKVMENFYRNQIINLLFN